MFNYLKKLFKTNKNSVCFHLNKEDFEVWKDSVRPQATEMKEKLHEDMSKTYCPIAKTNCLLTNCVHFQKSNILYYNGSTYLGMKPFFDVEPPKCKVWSKK